MKIKAEDLGLCVCGQRIGAAENGVIHDHPACHEFIEMEPTEFLDYVRRSRGIPDAAVERVQ
jgi:hypothetical protein